MASPDLYEMSYRRDCNKRPYTAPTASYSFDSENSTASNTPRPSIYTISRNVVLDDRMYEPKFNGALTKSIYFLFL